MINLLVNAVKPALILRPSCLPEKGGTNKKAIIRSDITIRNNDLP
jgi:hypothetical protein